MPLGSGPSLQVTVDGKVEGYERAMARAKAATSSYEYELAKLNKRVLAAEKLINEDMTRKLEARHLAMQRVARGAGAVALIAGAGLVAAATAAANFDQAMSNVQAATHETADNMDLLRSAALKAGQETKFSATEAATGIEALAKAGVSTKDILSGGLTDSLNLAAAGGLDVSQAAEIAATTMNQFGLAGKDVGHIADLLAAAAGKAQGEVTDMAEALKYVGPVAAQMGVSLDQTTGVIAELASQGILGSQAGTSLRGMLSSLTSPSKEAAKEMKTLGINMYDAQGQFVGFDGIAGQLHSTMHDLSAAERDEALGRIFGNQQVTAARILYSGGAKDVKDWTKQVNDSGYAADTAAIKMDNLKGDLEQLRGALETALIGTGSGSQGPLRSVTQDVTGLVNAYNQLPPATQHAIGGITGFVTLAGGTVFVVAKLAEAAKSVKTTFTDLGGSFSEANKGLLATRVAAGAAGTALLGLGSAVGDSHKTLGHFTTEMGAIALGFAVGGPWGAAIGGAVGLLGMLAGSNSSAAEHVAALTDSLDKQTGALTKDTRELAYNALAQTGAYDAAAKLGIPLATVTQAALGNADALAELNRRLDEMKKAASGDPSQYQTVQSLQRLLSAVGNEAGHIADARKEFQRHAEATMTAKTAIDQLTKAYGLTPRQVRTAIIQSNMGQGQADIRDLLHQYGLTPRQIKTAVSLLGTAAAEGALDHLTQSRTVTIFTHFAGGHADPMGELPHRASGGPVRAGQAYRVGEGGEETFIPDVSGRILSHAASQQRAFSLEVASVGRPYGGGAYGRSAGRGGPVQMTGTMTGTLDIPGFGPATFRAIARQEMDDAADFDRAMRGR